MRGQLYRVNITVESKHQFEGEVEGWKRHGRYCGSDKQNRPCMLYYHDYEAFVGKKNEDDVEQFCKREISKVEKKGYSVEKVHLRITEVKEVRNRKISVELLESRVKN